MEPKCHKFTPGLLRRYALHLREEERADSTIEKYVRDLEALGRHLAGRPVTKAALIGWKEELSQRHAPATVNSMIAAVNGFLRFMGWRECAVKLLNIQKSPFCDEGKELTRAEYARLVRAAERRENERLSLVIQTICATGIRVSELRFITVETVQAGRRSATRASGGSCSCPTSCGGCCRNISGRKKRPPGRCSPPRRASRWTNRTPGGT